MLILSSKKIKQKSTRLAYEIIENNYDSDEIILVGINTTGYRFAELLHSELKEMKPNGVSLEHLTIDPQNPMSGPDLKFDINSLNGKNVILVDDVANTGRTLFYMFKPFMDISPNKLEVAVLVNRKHKSYPISVDYVGMSLATTLRDNIRVNFEGDGLNATLE